MIDYGILFIIGTFILLGIYLLYPTIYNVKEPFVVNPVAEASAVGKVEGVESASELPTAPYGQHASNAPSSYRVYSTEPAARSRILELLEDLKAFLTFEGPNLQDKSDPQIQLPLSTARGDLRTLESQVEVIKRNPGIRSTINDENLREIFSNLEFLRGQARNVLGRELYSSKYTEKIKDTKEFESIEGFSDPIEKFTVGGRGLSSQERLLVDTLQDNYVTFFQNKPKATAANLQTHVGNIVSYLNTISGCNVSYSINSTTMNLCTNLSGFMPTDCIVTQNDVNVSKTGCLTGLTTSQLQGYLRTIKYELILLKLVSEGKLDEAQIPVSRESTQTQQSLPIFGIPTLPVFEKTLYAGNAYGKPEDNILSSGTGSSLNRTITLSPTSKPAPTITPTSAPTSISTPTPTSTQITTNNNSNSVKLSDVLEAYSRAMAEKTRLQALNTSDPETARRVENITKVTTYLNDIISKVNSGAMKESDITITKQQLEIYLKEGVTPQESNILSDLGLSSGLANLFSSNPDKNDKLMQQYGDKLLKGFSWNVDVGLKYTSDNEAMAGFNNNFSKSTDKRNNGLNITGFPTTDELNQALNDQYMESSSNPKPTPTDPYANDPRNEGRPVSTFDWKERSKFIETAIRKRNLNPNDFGIMPQGAEVSSDFNWKGYAKMICTRLGASYDTGLPEACGCPPMSWTGWR